ncbi:hypothetical protein DFJ73DRAFT_495637 [Zopfochytrium polystomum]|nr:hypothetical protein DFJ73DRAFT_495637 [Zopfochytrium polystomum]
MAAAILTEECSVIALRTTMEREREPFTAKRSQVGPAGAPSNEASKRQDMLGSAASVAQRRANASLMRKSSLSTVGPRTSRENAPSSFQESASNPPQRERARSTSSLFELIMPRPKNPEAGSSDDPKYARSTVLEATTPTDTGNELETGESDKSIERNRSKNVDTEAEDFESSPVRKLPSDAASEMSVDVSSRRGSMFFFKKRGEADGEDELAAVENKMLLSSAPMKRTHAQERVMHMYEATICRMRDRAKGMPVKDRKRLFRTYNECFTGSELVTWLLENCNLLGRDEALRFGQNLLEFSYIISVDMAMKLRDDNSIYIFQTSYLWPSHPWKVKGRDYLAFLLNRSKMNVLTPVEENRLNKLMKKYKKDINSIHEKAKSQKAAIDNLAKNDRRTALLQEWAFWTYHRPIDAKRIYDLMVDTESKKIKTERDLENSLKGEALREFTDRKLFQLHQSLARERLSVSAASKAIVQSCELMHNVDPFLDFGNVRNNPYLSEDPKKETIKTQPDIFELRLWCTSLNYLMKDALGVAAFTEFLKSSKETTLSSAFSFISKARMATESSFTTHIQFIEAVIAVGDEFLAESAPNALNSTVLNPEIRQSTAKIVVRAAQNCTAARAAGATIMIGLSVNGNGGRRGSGSSTTTTSNTNSSATGSAWAVAKSGTGSIGSGDVGGAIGLSRTTSVPRQQNNPIPSRRRSSMLVPVMESMWKPPGGSDSPTGGETPVEGQLTTAQSGATAVTMKSTTSEGEACSPLIACIALDCEVFTPAIESVMEHLRKDAYVKFLQSEVMSAHLKRVGVSSYQEADFQAAIAARRKKK